jgi:predicted nucleic acid-binding protein
VILVDTSIWVDHLRNGSPALAAALEREEVLAHPLVIGELACGTLKNRTEILQLMAALPVASVATDQEALELIERRRLMGKGIGYVDVHLLASAMMTASTWLWTRDRRLFAVASHLRIAFSAS